MDLFQALRSTLFFPRLIERVQIDPEIHHKIAVSRNPMYHFRCLTASVKPSPLIVAKQKDATVTIDWQFADKAQHIGDPV